MSNDFSLFAMLYNASPVVQLVMLILFLLSLASWAYILEKWMYLRNIQRDFAVFEAAFWSGGDLAKLYDELQKTSQTIKAGSDIFRSGFREFLRLKYAWTTNPKAVMEGTARVMNIAIEQQQFDMQKKLPFLASVGSTSPYIGLFGTVWGIMAAFHSLGSAKQVTLQMVAPGISEALVATAMGLFAAIPAVLAYNRLNHKTETIIQKYMIFADEFSVILHRKIYAPVKEELAS